METISTNLAMQKHGLFKDIRSFKKWCQSNGVTIFSDPPSNKQYVILEEFEKARFKKVTQYINKKHGLKSETENGNVTSKYQPKGKNESKFFNILRQKSRLTNNKG